MAISARKMYHLKGMRKTDTLQSNYTAEVVQHTSTALQQKSVYTFFFYLHSRQVLLEIQAAGCAEDMKVLYFGGGQIRMCTD